MKLHSEHVLKEVHTEMLTVYEDLAFFPFEQHT